MPKHDECSGHIDVIIDSEIIMEVAHDVLYSIFRLSTTTLINYTARIQCMHVHMYSVHAQVLITFTHACTVRMHAYIYTIAQVTCVAWTRTSTIYIH